MCQIDTYLGPPNIITHNIGKNFINKEFKQYATILKIAIKSIPVEAHNSVKIVKHYYSPLYHIYHIIIAELPDINKNIALQIVFKAINNFTGPNSFIPTLLVFRAYLCIIESDTPNPTVVK